MYTVLPVAICAVFLILYIILNELKFKKLINKIEHLYIENSKLSFRLFVAEKRQNIYMEKKSDRKLS